MATQNPVLQSQDLILTAPQPQYGASPEHTTRSFRPTAQTINGFTDANVDATAVGLFVWPEDGSAARQVRQIASISGTTATLDQPWSSVATVSTAIRAYQPSEVPWRVTTADAAAPFDVISTLHASVAAEPDGFWNGYTFICKSGLNPGAAKVAGAFTSSTGTAAAAANSATAIGDLFLARQMIRPAQPVDAKVTPKTLQRTIIGSGDQGADMPIVLANDGSVTVVVEQRPLATAGGAAVQAAPPVELGGLMRDHFTETKDTGGTVSAIDANSVTTTGGIFSVNGFALLNNGCAVQVLSTASAGATISKYGVGQTPTTNVTIGSVAYGGVTWTRKPQGSTYMHRLWDLYRGGAVRQWLGGSMPTLNLAIDRQTTVRFTFAYTSSEPLQYNRARPVALAAAFPLPYGDLGVPTDGKGARCVIDGTTVVMQSIAFDTGLTPGPRNSLGGLMQMDGMLMDLKAPTGTLKIYADQDNIAGFRPLMDRMMSGLPMHFLYQKDAGFGKTFCFASPTLAYTGGEFSYDGSPGQGIFTMPFTCVSPLAAVDAAGAALYPTATFPGVREFAFGIV